MQNQYAATLVVNLRDPKLSLEGRLSYARKGNQLFVQLAPGAAASTSADRDREILAQAERRLGGELALSPEAGESGQKGGMAQVGVAGTALDEDWLGTLVTMLVALGIVLLVLYGLVWVYHRFLSGRIGPGSGGYPIRHLGSFSIGPKQRVVVLDIDGEVVACGVTAQQISFLTRLESGRATARTRSAPAQGAASGGSGGKDPGPQATQEEAGPKDPVHQFAETLKDKVRSLKRIK